MSEQRMQQQIEAACAHIAQHAESVRHSRYRQRYHFMPQCGWLNDPNGLIYFKGKYHFFYQYNPYSGFWDRMFWGHAVSEDLLHWDYLPVALAPSEEYDDHPKGGCFSGSAIVIGDKLWVMYTGTCNNGNGFEQSQCVAWSEDGVQFHKYEGNPVLTAPEGVRPDCFRDPKVWEHDGLYYMVCGASRDGKAQALVYRSADFLHWEFFNVLAESRGEWGYMWECPDFFPLGDKYVLMFSPMGGGERTSVYLVGDFDYETGKFQWSTSGENDWGFDYYAPQSFLAPDGRRIMVAWANSWDWMPTWKDWGPTYREGWNGFFDLPREVRLLPDNSLQFLPVKELRALRRDPQFKDVLELQPDQEQSVTAGDGVAFELRFTLDLEHTDAEQVELSLRCGEGRRTVCTLDLKHSMMYVDRNNSDGWSRGVSKSPLFVRDKTLLDVHVFSDQSSLEIFTSDYTTNHSLNVFASDAQNGILLCARGGGARLLSLEGYGLERTFC